ncbi:hypothetical protein AC1031_021392 [Aphanomyces cochlioides]|nr:hypothetical protein AC1031_021392 [Aphanomyces cochlioides]
MSDFNSKDMLKRHNRLSKWRNPTSKSPCTVPLRPLPTSSMTHTNALAVLPSLDETQLSIAHSIHALKLSPAPRMLGSVPPRASFSDEKLNSAVHLIRVQ